MDIEPLLPDDDPLERARKTALNLGAHAYNGLRSVAVSRNPLAVAGIVAKTPTEEFAQDYGIPQAQVGRSLPEDMAIRAAGAANRATMGLPGLAARSIRGAAATLGDQLRSVFSEQRQGIQGVSGATIRQDPTVVDQQRREFDSGQQQGIVRG